MLDDRGINDLVMNCGEALQTFSNVPLLRISFINPKILTDTVGKLQM